jgi:hypothetical protein
VDTPTRRVHEDRARPVHDVAGRHLGGAGLHGVVARALAPVAPPWPHREDRADNAVHVQVRGANDGIDANDVAALPEVERLVHLLGDDDTHEPARLQCPYHRLVGPQIELLHLLALDVDPAGLAELTDQGRARQLAGKQLARERQLVQDDRQIAEAGCLRPEVLGQTQRNLVHERAPVRLHSVANRSDVRRLVTRWYGNWADDANHDEICYPGRRRR